MTPLQLISPLHKDLGGGLTVRRLLPSRERQGVGPFVFFDHFGPVVAQPGDNHDVRPHPHIGLATVTYLFEGAMMHRDSTGVVQRIEPGAVNLMTAGRGIVHSERTPADLAQRPRRSHGLQLWLALPEAHEEVAPGFQHVGAEAFTAASVDGMSVKVLIGSAFGTSSTVHAWSPTLYLDLVAGRLPDAGWLVPALAAERALYSLEQGFELDGTAVAAGVLAVLPPDSQPLLRAAAGTRLVMVGGTPLGHRHIVWNFVSSRRERIRQAQDDWAAQRFDRVPGETEFIPLPAPGG